MLLQSSVGQTGDQVSLLSPQRSFKTATVLTFFYNMWLNSTDTVGALKVYRYSKLHNYDQQMFSISGNQGRQWQKATICLPAGTYSLAFVGTIGLKYLSDIAIDSISLSADTPCNLGKTLNSQSSGL